MNFEDTPEEAEFRARCRAWLEKNAKLRDASSPSNPLGERETDEVIAQAKAWQAKKFDEGWACLTWPKEYGGQGLGRMEAVIWGQEEAKFETPPNVYQIGHGMLAERRSSGQRPLRTRAAADGAQPSCQRRMLPLVLARRSV